MRWHSKDTFVHFYSDNNCKHTNVVTRRLVRWDENCKCNVYFNCVSENLWCNSCYLPSHMLGVNHSVCKCFNSKDTKKYASVTPHFLHDKRRPAVKEDLSHSHCIPHRDIDVIFTFISDLSGAWQNPEQLSTSSRSSIFCDPMWFWYLSSYQGVNCKTPRFIMYDLSDL